MEYKLRNGKSVIVRKPITEDALSIINVIYTADSETKFLARNSGEFKVTEVQEKEFIRNILEDNDQDWFVAEYDGEIVGQCSVGLIRRTERCRHQNQCFVGFHPTYKRTTKKLEKQSCLCED